MQDFSADKLRLFYTHTVCFPRMVSHGTMGNTFVLGELSLDQECSAAYRRSGLERARLMERILSIHLSVEFLEFGG